MQRAGIAKLPYQSEVFDVVPDDKDIPDSDGWTLQALRHYVGERISQLDLRYQQRFDAQEATVAAALAAAERAVLKAEAASERRLESENQSMRAAVAIGVSVLAVTISIISLLIPATRVVYQQPPQIGTPVNPN
jgi:hypothetical protein